ncbi:MAG: hypothetical protein KAJ66_06735 [Candidatus Omnitrophica bacterium]|nr:hypothetical protein [Candidatus Omnitrophota bacterium]
MKRWVLLVVGLYVVSVSVLVVPIVLFFYKDGIDIIPLLYTYIIPVLILIQTVLLLIPFNIVTERPIKHRKVITSAIMGAFPMGFLVLMFIISAVLMVWGENTSAEYLYRWWLFIVPAVCWISWAVIFYKNYSNDNPKAFTATITRWLLRGSILELIVAIPSHIISRNRNECCAPPITFFGIITGISIALMSFGPGLFFLYAKKVKDKKITRG